jgi:predicted Zn finger-like uncharacterized protein
MIITCPSCSARYPVDAATFAPSGRKVRCAKCGNTWHQAPPSDLGWEEGDPAEKTLAGPAADVAANDDPVMPSASTQPKRPDDEKPLFKSGVEAGTPKGEARTDGPGELAAKSEAAASMPNDPVDDDDIHFAEVSVSDTQARADMAPGSGETGGTLRRDLKDVASMRRGRVLGAIGWIVLILFIAGSIYSVFAYRREIAAFWPSTVKFYDAAGTPVNLVGFELSQVTYERQEQNGLPVLAIKGMVINVSGEPKVAPRLRVGLRDDKQVELYHWTFALPDPHLEPDQKVNFVTRLSSPPAGARDLEVRFVTPGEEPDTVSGMTGIDQDVGGDTEQDAGKSRPQSSDDTASSLSHE